MLPILVGIRFASKCDAEAFLTHAAQGNTTPYDNKILMFEFQTLDEAINFTEQHTDIHAFKIFEDGKDSITMQNKPYCLFCTMPLNADTTAGSCMPDKLCEPCDYNSRIRCFAPLAN